MKNDTAQAAKAAQDAILALYYHARGGSDQALAELWRIGMLAAERMDSLVMDEQTGPRARSLARKKLKWPFMLAAVSEFRANGTTSDPNKYADWMGLGSKTAIKLKNPGKGGTRNLRPWTPSGLAYRVRLEIQKDLESYGKLTDSELLQTHYRTWSFDATQQPSANDAKKQKLFVRYVKAIRTITNIFDEGAWMKCATLWLEVYCEGDTESITPRRWPQSVYDRASRGNRTIKEVILTRIQEGLSLVIAERPAAQKVIG